MKFSIAARMICLPLVLLAIYTLPLGNSDTGDCFAMTAPDKIVIMPEVQVRHKRVSLMDLCQPQTVPDDWQGLFKGEDIGEAPSVGEQKFILAENLRTYLDSFFKRYGCDPQRIEMTVPERITVQRSSVRLPPEQIETIYRDYVLSHSPWNPRDLEIRRIYFSEAPQLPAGKVSHEVIADQDERFLGNVAITIQFFVDREKQRSLRVTGKVDLLQNVIHALTPLARNDIVREGDIEFQRTNVADDPDRYATDPEQVVGKQLQRDVGMHQPIVLKDLIQPLVVERGGLVTIVYQDGGLKLTASGEANGDGGIGDTIRVTNLLTKRTAICMVVNSKTVQVIH